MLSKPIIDFLKIDLFSYSPSLTFNGKKVHKSLFGILMTYIYITLTILAFVNFGRELIERKNPIVTIKEIKHSNTIPPRINMNPKDIKIALGISYSDRLIPFDETYFKVLGRQLIIKSKNKFGQFQYIIQYFRMITCPNERVPNGNNGEDSSPAYLCMDEKFSYQTSELPINETELQNKGFYLNGFFGADEYSQISIGFSRCENDTNNLSAPVCKRPEEIDEKISQIYIGGALLNKYLDLEDYENPFRNNLEWFFSKPNNTMRKELQIYFQKQKLTTDVGWLISKEEVVEYFVMSDERELIENSDNDLNVFMNISFQIDNIEKDYTRRYKKVQDLAAEVGGIMKLLLMFLSLLIRPIGLNSYKKELVQSVFGGSISNKSKKSSIRYSGLRNCLCRLFYRRASKKKENTKVWTAYNFIDEKLDLKNLFNKVIEIERLSQIIFENYQYILFKTYCSNQRWINLIDLDPTRIDHNNNKFDSRLADYHSSIVIKNFKQALIDLKRRNSPNDGRIIDQNLKIVLKKDLEGVGLENFSCENISSLIDEYVGDKSIPKKSSLKKPGVEFRVINKSKGLTEPDEATLN